MQTPRHGMHTRAHRHGAALGAAIGAVALVSVITVTTVVSYRAEHAPAQYKGANIPDALVVATAVSQAGVTPVALTVAGLSATEAQLVINEAVSQAESRMTQLRVSMENIETARSALQVAEGDSLTSDAQLATLRQTLDDAVSTRDEIIALVQAPAIASFDAGELRRFGNFHSAPQGDLPPMLLAKDWSADDVARLSAASRRLSAAAARGESDPDAQAEYDAALADPDVAAANANYDQRLAAIQTAWDTALAPTLD